MKISELVARLESVKEERGDLDVFSTADYALVNEVSVDDTGDTFGHSNGQPIVVIEGCG